jgi:transketolase
MRKTCFEKVYTLAKSHDDVVFVGSDLGAGVLDRFKQEMPERFLMEGVSEQHLIGMSAGLAREGFTVYVSTIATFLTRRAYEQIVLDAALHRLKIRLLGIGGGLVYAPLGPTHLAIDDIALMRAVPKMAVIAPSDAVEMARVMDASYGHPGPLYIRIAKGSEPIVTPENRRFTIGKGYLVRKGTDVLVVTTGVTQQLAWNAAEILTKTGVSVAILHLPTVKPIDVRILNNLASTIRRVVTVEEHSSIGGLGSAVYDSFQDAGIPVRSARIALPDSFPAGYGSQADMMDRNGVSSVRVVREVTKLLK